MSYDWRMNTNDRVGQVSWLEELASNIASHRQGEDTAEELVNYFLSKRGMREWNIDLPGWFDSGDRAILVRMVADSIGQS